MAGGVVEDTVVGSAILLIRVGEIPAILGLQGVVESRGIGGGGGEIASVQRNIVVRGLFVRRIFVAGRVSALEDVEEGK